MKLFQSTRFWIMSTVICLVGYGISCTKTNQVVVPGISSSNSNVLLSVRANTPPTIDGSIEAAWDNVQKLSIAPTVPDPGNGLFTGYIGEMYPGTIRSMYDDQFIYLLVEIKDNDKNIKSAPWYFNPATQLWAREATARVYDVNGVLTRTGFGEDKLAFLWNVNNSTAKFTTQTCYASCHIFTPYLDYATNPATQRSNAGSGNHYTNGANEKIDMWWLHPNRGFAYGVMDDNYQDWAGGQGVTNLAGGNGNGRHFDDLVVSGTSTTWPFRPNYTADATQGSITNTQNLKLDGTGTSVAVPLWIIPNSTADFLKVEDTLAGGTARKVTGVSSTGVLTYTGGSLDPNTGTDYKRLGTSATAALGAKCVPSSIISPVLRGRADISIAAVHTGTGWIYEIKRAIKTADVLNQDIDFTGFADQPFGVAFWNSSNYQHGIQPNLLLQFKK